MLLEQLQGFVHSAGVVGHRRIRPPESDPLLLAGVAAEEPLVLGALTRRDPGAAIFRRHVAAGPSGAPFLADNGLLCHLGRTETARGIDT